MWTQLIEIQLESFWSAGSFSASCLGVSGSNCCIFSKDSFRKPHFIDVRSHISSSNISRLLRFDFQRKLVSKSLLRTEFIKYQIWIQSNFLMVPMILQRERISICPSHLGYVTVIVELWILTDYPTGVFCIWANLDNETSGKFSNFCFCIIFYFLLFMLLVKLVEVDRLNKRRKSLEKQ